MRKKESRIKRQAQQLAWGLAALMEQVTITIECTLESTPSTLMGTCLASAYDEEVGDHYRYRYAVLCGGEAAKRALKTAQLDPGDSDEPGPHRRIAIAGYEDYEEFIERLPRYLNDVIRDLETKVEQMRRLRPPTRESDWKSARRPSASPGSCRRRPRAIRPRPACEEEPHKGYEFP